MVLSHIKITQHIVKKINEQIYKTNEKYLINDQRSIFVFSKGRKRQISLKRKKYIIENLFVAIVRPIRCYLNLHLGF